MLSFPLAKSVAALIAVSLFLVSSGSSRAEDIKPLRALLVLGGCCHYYNAQKDLLAKGIAERAHVEIVIAYDPDTTTNFPCQLMTN